MVTFWQMKNTKNDSSLAAINKADYDEACLYGFCLAGIAIMATASLAMGIIGNLIAATLLGLVVGKNAMEWSWLRYKKLLCFGLSLAGVFLTFANPAGWSQVGVHYWHFLPKIWMYPILGCIAAPTWCWLGYRIGLRRL